jgi:hypothetical protein
MRSVVLPMPLAEEAARRITEDLLPRMAVARHLGVCERTLWNWEKSGQGPPAIRVGKKVFYRSETVRRWLLDQETGPAMT